MSKTVHQPLLTDSNNGANVAAVCHSVFPRVLSSSKIQSVVSSCPVFLIHFYLLLLTSSDSVVLELNCTCYCFFFSPHTLFVIVIVNDKLRQVSFFFQTLFVVFYLYMPKYIVGWLLACNVEP